MATAMNVQLTIRNSTAATDTSANVRTDRSRSAKPAPPTLSRKLWLT
jgi:hypothetical protein